MIISPLQFHEYMEKKKEPYSWNHSSKQTFLLKPKIWDLQQNKYPPAALSYGYKIIENGHFYVNVLLLKPNFYLRLQGSFQLCRPMASCFLDGPEAGIGSLFGKKFKKWPEFWVFGLILYVFIALEPLEWPIRKINITSNQRRSSSRILLKLFILQTFRKIKPQRTH